jgi:hypothetical protein
LQNVANNFLDAFIDYKGVIKFWNPMVNARKRVEVPKKTTHAPSTKKRRRVETTKEDNTSKSDQERRRLKLLEKPRK